MVRSSASGALGRRSSRSESAEVDGRLEAGRDLSRSQLQSATMQTIVQLNLLFINAPYALLLLSNVVLTPPLIHLSFAAGVNRGRQTNKVGLPCHVHPTASISVSVNWSECSISVAAS